MALEIKECPTLGTAEDFKCHRKNLLRLTRNAINDLFVQDSLPNEKSVQKSINNFNEFLIKYNKLKKEKENLYIRRFEPFIIKNVDNWTTLFSIINYLLIINTQSSDQYYDTNEIFLKKVATIIPILLLFFIVEDVNKVDPKDTFFRIC